MQSKRSIVTTVVQKTFRGVLGVKEVIPASMPFIMHDPRRFLLLDDGLGAPIYSIPQQLSSTGDAVADIHNDGCIESRVFIEICDELEYAFSMRLPDSFVRDVETVNDLITYLTKQLRLPYLRQIDLSRGWPW